MVTRADTFSQTQKKKILFSDFLDSFAVSPIGGVLAKVTNEDSVKQSVKNIVLTNTGERFFNPNLGGDVNKSLFEMNDALTPIVLKEKITNAIGFYEPRVNQLIVEVIESTDSNYLTINITFYVISNPAPISISINLLRVR